MYKKQIVKFKTKHNRKKKLQSVEQVLFLHPNKVPINCSLSLDHLNVITEVIETNTED